jgi:hypothetical protein
MNQIAYKTIFNIIAEYWNVTWPTKQFCKLFEQVWKTKNNLLKSSADLSIYNEDLKLIGDEIGCDCAIEVVEIDLEPKYSIRFNIVKRTTISEYVIMNCVLTPKTTYFYE